MAIVVKRETAFGRQREEALVRKLDLQQEIKKIKQENEKAILKSELKWMAILGLLLIFIFPFGFLIGWFIGRETALDQLCKGQRRELRNVSQKIKIQRGESGENKVSHAIETLLPNNNLLLNDLVIPNGKNGTQIDHVLIGEGKLFCIETKDITGKFYPHRDGWMWYPAHSQGKVRKKTIVKNPQHQSLYHAQHLNNLLKRNGFTVEIRPVVILTNPYGEWKGRQDHKCPILRVKEFVQYASRENDVKLTEDTKVKIANLLSASDQQHSKVFYDQF
ncbi:MAG: nuclease-related domain-containing protein [Bacillota bacterium]